ASSPATCWSSTGACRSERQLEVDRPPSGASGATSPRQGGRKSVTTAVLGGKLPPIALTTNCPSCGVGLVAEELREQAYVCDCGHHFRMHGDAWVALLADEGTWEERWAEVRPHDLLEWKLPKPYQETIDQAREEGLNEAVRTGTAALAGRPVWLGVFDFRFVGGTLSVVAGERLARTFAQAS